ncbi:MAG: DNA-binding protein [Anaerococcus obesiensis]
MKGIFMNAKDVQEFLDVSRTTAYQIINDMNQDLLKLGYRVQRGKVNREYIMEKYCYKPTNTKEV